MATTSETLRAYQGPAILSYGFRPFFLGGAIWAVVAMALFIFMLTGKIELPTAFNPIDWHLHELLYGFMPAIIAGFLLTAVPNWTGRLPVAGAPLAALFALWLAGRIAVSTSAVIGIGATAVIDVSFIVVLGFVAAREIVAGGNKNNLKLLVLVSLLAIGNAVFYIETADGDPANCGKRIAIAVAILLISLIGGRLAPSFTRNWLVKRGVKALPVPFGKFDMGVIAISAIALATWIFAPDALLTAGLCATAGVLQSVRVLRWKGYLTVAEPLLAILHVGYVFVPLGFLLMAAGIAFPEFVAPVAAVHTWTAGAIGVMTLAVMTRASLAHTGRELHASPATVAIYAFAILGVFCRIAAAFGIEPMIMLHAAATCWMLAFGGFALVYGRMLLTPR